MLTPSEATLTLDKVDSSAKNRPAVRMVVPQWCWGPYSKRTGVLSVCGTDLQSKRSKPDAATGKRQSTVVLGFPHSFQSLIEETKLVSTQKI